MIKMKQFMALLLCLLIWLVNPVQAIEEGDLLDVDKAFAFSASMIDADTLRVQWDIAPTYYMYRKKIRFSTQTPGVTLGTPILPPGKVKQDEFFGRIEIYRKQVVAEVPVVRKDPGISRFELTAISQGCTDLGVCYPPHTQKASLTLPTQKAKPLSALFALDQLSNSLGLGATDNEMLVLEPDQAFKFIVDVEDPNTLVASWQIAEGHYLYRNKFKFSLQDSAGVKLGKVILPPGESKTDEFFGTIQVFHNYAEARIPLIRSQLEATQISLVSTYQGCSEITGICYPPIKKLTPMDLPASKVSAKTITPAVTTISTTSQATPQPPLSEQDTIAASLASGSALLTIATFFGFGLLLAFTPCVFPMIPILSSIIVGQGENLTTRRAFVMSLTYVLAMAVTYTIAGIMAGMFGENLQAAFQNPWILGSFAGVFVLLSLSMFGFYDLQLPSALQSKLADVSNRQRGGSLVGVAIMGFLSALIVGPCVAAPLAGALIYIGQTGDAVLGGVALFALSMGMGAPLIAIGTSAGKLLPKAGGWMGAVKSVFGVMLLAVAIWMLERILPVAVTMLLWAVLLIISGIYLKALEPLGIKSSGWARLWKGIGLILILYGALLMVGAATGGKDLLQPLKGLALGGGGAATVEHLPFKRIKSIADLEREVATANARNQTVMLDFYADWCIACKELEKYTFSDPNVRQALANVVLLQADVTANDDVDKALLKHFKLIGPPTIMFFGLDGKERYNYRVVGFMNAEQFHQHLLKALN